VANADSSWARSTRLFKPRYASLESSRWVSYHRPPKRGSFLLICRKRHRKVLLNWNNNWIHQMKQLFKIVVLASSFNMFACASSRGRWFTIINPTRDCSISARNRGTSYWTSTRCNRSGKSSRRQMAVFAARFSVRWFLSIAVYVESDQPGWVILDPFGPPTFDLGSTFGFTQVGDTITASHFFYVPSSGELSTGIATSAAGTRLSNQFKGSARTLDLQEKSLRKLLNINASWSN